MPVVRLLYGNLYTTLLTPTPVVIETLDNLTSCYTPGYQHDDSYKCIVIDEETQKPKRQWDGKRHLLTKTNRFPSGLLPMLQKQLADAGYTVELSPSLVNIVDVEKQADFHIVRRQHKWNWQPGEVQLTHRLAEDTVLRVDQIEACLAYLTSPLLRGVLRVATGGGKTAIAAALSLAMPGPTLGLIHGIDLLQQTREYLADYIGEPVGLIGSGDFQIENLTVASVETIYPRLHDPKVQDLLRKVQFVWCDEVHRAGSKMWTKILRAIPTGFRLGMSGTPFKREELRDLLLQAWTGPQLYDMPTRELQAKGILAKADLTMIRIGQPDGELENESWRSAQEQLIFENEERSRVICDLAIDRAKQGKKVFLLAGNRIKFAWLLYNQITEDYRGVEIATGQFTASGRNTESLKMFRSGVVNILVSTVVFDEGINVPDMNVVILANCGKSYVKTMQRIGRGLRKKKGSLEVIDFLDETNKYLRSHARTRLGYYGEEDIFQSVRVLDESGKEEAIG